MVGNEKYKSILKKSTVCDDYQYPEFSSIDDKSINDSKYFPKVPSSENCSISGLNNDLFPPCSSSSEYEPAVRQYKPEKNKYSYRMSDFSKDFSSIQGSNDCSIKSSLASNPIAYTPSPLTNTNRILSSDLMRQNESANFSLKLSSNNLKIKKSSTSSYLDTQCLVPYSNEDYNSSQSQKLLDNDSFLISESSILKDNNFNQNLNKIAGVQTKEIINNKQKLGNPQLIKKQTSQITELDEPCHSYQHYHPKRKKNIVSLDYSENYNNDNSDYSDITTSLDTQKITPKLSNSTLNRSTENYSLTSNVIRNLNKTNVSDSENASETANSQKLSPTKNTSQGSTFVNCSTKSFNSDKENYFMVYDKFLISHLTEIFRKTSNLLNAFSYINERILHSLLYEGKNDEILKKLDCNLYNLRYRDIHLELEYKKAIRSETSKKSSKAVFYLIILFFVKLSFLYLYPNITPKSQIANFNVYMDGENQSIMSKILHSVNHKNPGLCTYTDMVSHLFITLIIYLFPYTLWDAETLLSSTFFISISVQLLVLYLRGYVISDPSLLQLQSSIVSALDIYTFNENHRHTITPIYFFKPYNQLTLSEFITASCPYLVPSLQLSQNLINYTVLLSESIHLIIFNYHWLFLNIATWIFLLKILIPLRIKKCKHVNLFLIILTFWWSVWLTKSQSLILSFLFFALSNAFNFFVHAFHLYTEIKSRKEFWINYNALTIKDIPKNAYNDAILYRLALYKHEDLMNSIKSYLKLHSSQYIVTNKLTDYINWVKKNLIPQEKYQKHVAVNIKIKTSSKKSLSSRFVDACYSQQKAFHSAYNEKSVDSRYDSQRVHRGHAITNLPIISESCKRFSSLEEQVGFDWEFDCLNLSSLTENVLTEVGYILLKPYCVGTFNAEKGGPAENLGVSKTTVTNFLYSIQNLYQITPYHNQYHGAGVGHAMAYMCRHLQIFSQSNAREKATMLIAALCHDVGYDQLALVYNDQSILENFHAYTTFCTLDRDECDVLKNLTIAEFRTTRQQIIELILATDMKHHFDAVTRLKVRALAPDFNHLTNEDLLLTIKMAMKFADLSHGAISWEKHYEWSCRITEEFYLQGDEEVRLNLPSSPLCDRAGHNCFATSQVGFLDFVVRPLATELVRFDFSGTLELLTKHLSNNIDKWRELSESPNADNLEYPERFNKFLSDNVWRMRELSHDRLIRQYMYGTLSNLCSSIPSTCRSHKSIDAVNITESNKLKRSHSDDFYSRKCLSSTKKVMGHRFRWHTLHNFCPFTKDTTDILKKNSSVNLFKNRTKRSNSQKHRLSSVLQYDSSKPSTKKYNNQSSTVHQTLRNYFNASPRLIQLPPQRLSKINDDTSQLNLNDTIENYDKNELVKTPYTFTSGSNRADSYDQFEGWSERQNNTKDTNSQAGDSFKNKPTTYVKTPVRRGKLNSAGEKTIGQLSNPSTIDHQNPNHHKFLKSKVLGNICRQHGVVQHLPVLDEPGNYSRPYAHNMFTDD